MEESGFCDDPLQKLKGSRSAKLGALTKKRNEIAQLMGNYGNLELVQAKMAKDFLKLRAELNELNENVKGMLNKISEAEVKQDQTEWYKPKAASLDEFEAQIEKWTKTAQQQQMKRRFTQRKQHSNSLTLKWMRMRFTHRTVSQMSLQSIHTGHQMPPGIQADHQPPLDVPLHLRPGLNCKLKRQLYWSKQKHYQRGRRWNRRRPNLKPKRSNWKC